MEGIGMENEHSNGTGGHRIVAVGVGGAGCRLVHSVHTSLKGVETIAINSDSVTDVEADKKLQIGTQLLNGNGANGSVELGRKCAEESRELIADIVGKADIAFVITGMGGGIGTGASPVVAEIAKHAGAVVVGIAIMPLSVEGRRKERAIEGVDVLRKNVDSMIPFEMDSLLAIRPDAELGEALEKVNEYVLSIVSNMAESVNIPWTFEHELDVHIGGAPPAIFIHGDAKCDIAPEAAQMHEIMMFKDK